MSESDEIKVHPFGKIKSEGSSVTYTVAAQVSGSWHMKMYQTRPGSREPIELPSVTMVAEELWPPTNTILVEIEEWDILSDEALLDFEESLD